MFLVSYLFNKSCKLASWAYNCISPTADKTEKVAQSAIGTSILSRFTNWITSLFSQPTESREVAEQSASKTPENQSISSTPTQMRWQDNPEKFLKEHTFKEDPLGYTKAYEITAKSNQEQTQIPVDLTTSQFVMPDKGDCMFQSLIYAYLQLIYPSEEIPSYEALPVQHLRETLVAYERKEYNADPDLKKYVDICAVDYRMDKIKKLKDEIKNIQSIFKLFPDATDKTEIEKLEKQISELEALSEDELRSEYFTKMTSMDSPRTFGGDAELHAFSKTFNVRIDIEADYPTKPFNKDAERSLTLRFVNGNHYNVSRKT